MSLAIPWDEFGAYIFDIDGTLLHCTDAVHYFAFCSVLSSVAGRSVNLDGVTAHGNTDVGMLRDAFLRAGIPPSQWRPRLPELRDAMCRHVEDNRSDLCVNILPSVRQVLWHLRGKGALLSVATGNLERIAKQKLTAAGLIESFDFAACSDAFEDRESVFRHAIAQIRCNSDSKAAILAFGDTPADIAAARCNHISVVAVATGIYSYECLISESPSLCIRSFAELLE